MKQSNPHKIGKVFLYDKRIRVKISEYEHNTPIDDGIPNSHIHGKKFYTYSVGGNDWTRATGVAYETL